VAARAIASSSTCLLRRAEDFTLVEAHVGDALAILQQLDPRDYQEFCVWPELLNLFMPLPG
jgi:hypothetical protein